MLKADNGEISQAIALNEKSLAINEQIGNLKGKAANLHQLGTLKADNGDISQAIDLYEQSLAINKQIGNVRDQAATLHNLGGIKADKGEISEAIALYKQSISFNEQVGNLQGKAATLYKLMCLKGNNREIEEAIALFQQSLAIKKIGNVQSQAITLSYLGRIAEQQHNYNQALYYLQLALEILQRIQSPDAEEVRQMVVRVQDLIRN
ncbi:hypothetical protein BV375_28470 [Nostoc sp. 106C]|nr:hypothetical protein BV375_28470 [Nostoc sp. 106C]